MTDYNEPVPLRHSFGTSTEADAYPPAAVAPPMMPKQPPDRPPAQRRRRRWPAWAIVLTTLAVVIIVIAVALAVIKVPYFTVSPGPSEATNGMVSVENAETYESDGELLLTTVSVKPVNGWELIRSMFDPDDELVAEEAITQGRSDDQVEQVNQEMMDNSQLVATDVALRELGYEARLVGDGALVVEVSDDAPAADVLEAGDVITGVDGQPVATSGELTDALADKKPGDTTDLEIDRDGSAESVSVEMIANPDDPGTSIIGVVVTTEEVRVETTGSDVEVEIDAGDIGGPSAGLVYTLTIINDLTPDDITKGRVVAATGEINQDGSVGPIGGIAQKVRSVEENGAEIFLVPEDNLEEALTVDTDVQVVGVADIDEALEALDAL